MAWRDIAELINLKFATYKTIDKCQRKMKYLINAYKEKKEWNKNQTGGNLRKSVFYDEIDAVLGCRDILTLRHVLDAGAHDSSTRSSSSDSETSPVNVIREIKRENRPLLRQRLAQNKRRGKENEKGSWRMPMMKSTKCTTSALLMTSKVKVSGWFLVWKRCRKCKCSKCSL